MKWTHQILVYADDANILGGSAHPIKKNLGVLITVNKEIGLEVNAYKTKYILSCLAIGMQDEVTV
jgi:hypothetical protein